MKKYAIGLDFGTLSVRALLLDIQTGEEVATSLYEYPHGVMEEELPCGKKLSAGFALQDPQDYLEGMKETIRGVIGLSGRDEAIAPEEIIGIGVDFTSSTIIAAKKDGTPLCQLPEFQNEPHAYVKLWKHHGGEKEAIWIDRIAHERKESWLPLYGGKVSSEWMFPKILETLHHAPEVYHAADRFMEALDWIIWQMTGTETRSACGAGYKAFYRHDNGYPSEDFFRAIDPEMEHIVEEKLSAPVKGIGEPAGKLTEEMADILGLLPGTPVGTGIIDAHASLPGSGIGAPGTMMIIVGTSSCHMILSETEVGIEGVGGLVKDGIMPGYFGYEAGQCCVGDHFSWFTEHCLPENYTREAKEKGISLYRLLEEKLTGYKAGQSGLLALDWFNGVRSPLMDFDLSGMILGMNLLTKPEEIYMALIEATAYGTRMIIESFEAAGVAVDSLILSGGIPAKNKLLVQIYADVCKKEIKLSASSYASARGAAILGAAAGEAAERKEKATEEETTAPGSTIEEKSAAGKIAQRLGKISDTVYTPNPENSRIYDQLYQEYKTLFDYFGRGENDVMKRLNKVRNEKTEE